MLAAAFADVLNVKRVGIYDNFFQLGGHSLSGMRLVSRIRQELQVTLAVRTIFDAPSVVTLSAIVDQIAAGKKVGDA